MKMKTPHDYYMETQERLMPRANNYTLPEDWQLQAMEDYAKSKIELKDKLSKSISEMIGNDLKRCTYYHKGATFVETEKGQLMIRVEYYNPSKVVLD